jgi:hypothetical protein
MDPAGDRLAAEHVAPVVAWLLGPRARHVTGRVLEAGDGTVSMPDGWRPGAPFPLPPLASAEAADALLRQVTAGAAPPLPLISSAEARLSPAAPSPASGPSHNRH